MGSKREQRVFPKGKYLFRAGDPAGDLYFITAGEVALFKVNRDQDEIEIARVKAGDVLGVMTILNNDARTASARAETDVTVDIVPRDRLERLMVTVPKWLKVLLKDLIARVNIANAKYIDIARMWDDGALASPGRVEMACQVAEGIRQFHTVMAESAVDVKLSEILPRVERVLGYRREDLAVVVELLQSSGFLKKLAEPVGSFELSALDAFAQFAKDFRSEKSKILRRQIEFSAQDRRKLSHLVAVADKLGVSPAASAVFSFDNLAATMEKLIGRAFEPLIVEAAGLLSLVVVERSEEGISVRFIPAALGIRLRCIELFRRLEFGDSQLKSVG